MKRLIALLIFGIFLIGFTSAAITGASVDNGSKDKGNDNSSQNGQDEIQNQNKGGLSQAQIKNVIQERNRLRTNASSCPNNCTCQGSTTRCQLNGNREMTIQAGNSGNTIIQVKGEQAQTQVQLYKSNGKLYGNFKGNITKRILDPEQIKERIQERLQLQNCSCENMTLNEDGTYQIQTQKEARLFGLFKVREKIRFEYDAGNGELVKEQNSWWGFLAKDIKEEPFLGNSCGTVTPGQNDACCQNKGYDLYNSEKGECIFSE
jgi:hypothetical protein